MPKNNLSYEEALHGVQCAIGFESTLPGNKISNVKHLRTGIDSAHVTNKAIADLLISKGIITLESYLEALRKAMNEELDNYEEKYPGIKFR